MVALVVVVAIVAVVLCSSEKARAKAKELLAKVKAAICK